jgi:ribonuclease E
MTIDTESEEEKDKKKPSKVKIVPDKKKKVSIGAWWKNIPNLLPEKKKKDEKEEATTEKKEFSASQKEKTADNPEPIKGEDVERKKVVDRVDEDKPKPGKQETAPKKKTPVAEPAAITGRNKSKVQNTSKNKSKKPEEDVLEEQNEKKQEKKGLTKLLINAEESEECRIALVDNGRLDSYHVTTVVRERTKNNVYKGKIVAVEANLQAAFVEIGTDRNGFLPFAEIHPEYYREDISDEDRKFISQGQWRKLKIENVIRRGQEVLVQVVKEVTGNKGANMTTYLSLPGRCLVLLPGSDSAGISRKIVGEERRSALREIMSGLSISEGVGYIIRTASADITKVALQQDLRFLVRLWKEIRKRGQTMAAPALIYEDQDTVVRFLRDHFVAEIDEIQVDTEESLAQVKQFIELLPAKQKKVRVKLHRGAKPIFNQNNVEEQIESIYKPQVPLVSGGSIVIDPTEALVAIDVNSGRTSKNGDFDATIFQANMEAAAELARQLRLRDLGGLIVVDFIDMRNKKHIREVEKQVKTSMKRDKAKFDISKLSRFGLMQISRQKMGAPIEKGSYLTCEHCQGRGVIKSVENQALYALRRIQTGILREKVVRVGCRLPIEVAGYLLNKKRKELAELESKHKATIDIIPRPEMKPADIQLEFF